MNRQGVLLVVVLILLAGLVGHNVSVFLESDVLKSKPGPSATLKLPTAIDLTVGEPKELRADTPGKRVVWMSLDEEVKLRQLNDKAVWVYGTKPGKYRITAWTSINDIPTLNEICEVKVGEDPERVKDASDYMRQKEGVTAKDKEKVANK